MLVSSIFMDVLQNGYLLLERNRTKQKNPNTRKGNGSEKEREREREMERERENGSFKNLKQKKSL